MLALVLAGLAGCTSATATRQIASPPPITSHWQVAPHLAHELAAPFFAPSNPQVAYELPAPSDNGVAHGLQRTDDGGATWQALPMPHLPGPMMDAAFRVSPVDAHNVFLQLDFGVTLNSDGSLTCPAPRSGAAPPLSGRFLFAPRSNAGNCPALFFSTDGGNHWESASLPTPDYLFNANLEWPLTQLDAIQAQGSHLYADIAPIAQVTSPIGMRLLVSADHGATWQFADNTLFSQATAICTAVATQHGTSLFALTADGNCFDASDTTRTLWRSDDSGATWIQEGALPSLAQQLLATSGNGSQQPVLYAIAHDGPTLSDIQVSANGGHSWQTAPLSGVPNTMKLAQIAGLLSDGSLVAAMLPRTSTSTSPPASPTTAPLTLYALTAGAAAWHPISPPSPPLSQPGYLLVAPGAGSAPDTIWVVSLTGNPLQPGATYAAVVLLG